MTVAEAEAVIRGGKLCWATTDPREKPPTVVLENWKQNDTAWMTLRSAKICPICLQSYKNPRDHGYERHLH